MRVFKTLGIVSLMILIVSCQKSSQIRQDEEMSHRGISGDYYGMRNRKSLNQNLDSISLPKKSVLILDFWNDTPIKQENLGAFVAEELKRGLALTQRVVLPEDIKSDMGTSDFVDGDRVKVAQLIREGRRLGVSILVIGRIKRIVFRQKGDNVGLFRQKQSLAAVELEVKVFDTQGGREIYGTTKLGETSKGVIVAFEGNDGSTADTRIELTQAASREAIAAFLPEVLRSIEKMTWQGRVAKLVGPRIFINAGKASGLVQGDILRVLTPGEDIYDPASGAYLGRAKGQMKGTLEVIDFIGTDGAVSHIHTGGNFREGDLVQLY